MSDDDPRPARCDSQLACGRHLNRVAATMLAIENRVSATLTVTPTTRMLARWGVGATP